MSLCTETFATARVFFPEWSGAPVLGADALARGWTEGHTLRGHAASLRSQGHVESLSLEDHLTWLVDEVRARLPGLVGPVRLDFFCFWVSARGHGGPHLSAALLARVAELGASLSFDVYFEDEPERAWSALRRQLSGEPPAVGGTRAAQAAIERLLGPQLIDDAVTEYLSHGEWSELARSVLRLLRSPTARRVCLETIEGGEPDRRRGATELLRAICTPESVELLRPLLADADPEVAMWAAKGIDDLAWELPEAELERWIQELERSAVSEVRAVAAELRERFDQPASGSR